MSIDCSKESSIEKDEAFRCHTCGCRILYKKRTNKGMLTYIYQ